ncbi:MAG: helix-turn-helix transcriptional regulator [Bacteroidia bacterium]|nr:helix-turn-helix transcriptional regulator [Bacteroidia bacterium]
MKKKILVIIEKTKDGFSAYAKEYPVFTTGSSMNKLFHNIREAFIFYFDDEAFDESLLSYEIDFNQFFKYYKVLNSKALAGRIGMHPTLLSQYVSGHKKPSASQSRKILYGINKIGQELSEMSVIYERKKSAMNK